MSITELIAEITKVLPQIGAAPESRITRMPPVSGGCISTAHIVETSDQKYFVKSHTADSFMTKQMCKSMFEAELHGLNALRHTHTIRVPQPLHVGDLSSGAFLILEYIPLTRLRDHHKLGHQLAYLHLFEGPSQFGFDTNNYIGSTMQPNGWHDTWVDLLQERLQYQFDRAQFTGHMKNMADKLIRRLTQFFKGLDIRPSLVHGDLWAGNCAADSSGEPVVFDPAVYWGHHEAELSIMRMFGGFTLDFYDAYHERIPRAPGFELRAQIYELYHTVNHYNMFGSGYLDQCQRLLERILQ
ncbi:hypothetical protein IW139_004122 [Coemansia sp. RSA 353]|nr:hypothetical protein J3F82_002634 [Coemansia sp. RSA 637]KAJ2184599.1 hypothetical protein EV181_004297 [Coemansia sp. RSA 532]KAJ2203256.1 hypothetical protein IW145_004183 [Coemansia sp. RSA 521]KAJ2219133.1 hypothetical protein IW143_002819 [Coemansia sp. RSA 520]KAJ2221286.1 hypothetical protein EV180_004713 [Coemansia sp. RSA 518]KAJ2269470.1 hypothetical protein J3F81_004304 [Coemansia sp. RSA 371]KAJ2273847.1 hypothetical protein GGH14_004271 [Coemansia sp. RSA 370]KAJ2294913.1 hyp